MRGGCAMYAADSHAPEIILVAWPPYSSAATSNALLLLRTLSLTRAQQLLKRAQHKRQRGGATPHCRQRP